MKKIVLLLSIASYAYTMDVDVEPLSKKRSRTISSASSASSDTIVLTDAEKDRCQWVIEKMKESNNILEKYTNTKALGFYDDTATTVPLLRKTRKDALENKELLVQNQLIRLANEMELELNNKNFEPEKLELVQKDLEKLASINKHVYESFAEPVAEQPRKKQKR